MNTPRSHAACETCGSTDRVRPYGMDGTPLCWAHMLEANAKEDAHATPDRVAEVVAETLWLIDATALHGEPGYKAKALSECSPRVRAGFALRAAAVLSALRNAGLKVTDA